MKKKEYIKETFMKKKFTQKPNFSKTRNSLSLASTSVECILSVNSLIPYAPALLILASYIKLSAENRETQCIGLAQEPSVPDEELKVPHQELKVPHALEVASAPNWLLDNYKPVYSGNRKLLRNFLLKKSLKSYKNNLIHLGSLGYNKWIECEKLLESNKLFKKFHISGRVGMLVLLGLSIVLFYHSLSLFLLKNGAKYASKSIVTELASNDVVIKSKNAALEWAKDRPFLRPVLITLGLGVTVLCIIFYVKGVMKVKVKIPYPGPRTPFAMEIDPCLEQQFAYVLRKIEEARAVLLKELEEINEVLPPHWPTQQDLRDLKIIDENNRAIGFSCICELGTICNLTVWQKR